MMMTQDSLLKDKFLRKQLLLAKGELLRIKLRLEVNALSEQPLGKMGGGVLALALGSQATHLTNSVLDCFPEGKLRRWLRLASWALQIWRVGAKKNC